ncbi:MAG: hypothetical protein J7L35_01560 [Anaerolineales bacterium]|nr:hypothetical protein [Anaerolineales bacterium]
MSEVVQQAETAIKAGDTKTGFKILRQVLVENPESEKAWWIMSGLVQRKERATCLEQVLRINPGNQFARDALNQLRASPPITETKPRRKIPKPAPGKRPTGKTEPIGGYKTWHYTRGSKVFLIILGEQQVFWAQTEKRLIPRVREILKTGKIPDHYLSEIKAIRLTSITSIKLLKTSLQFQYLYEGADRTARMVLEDTVMSERIMDLLVNQLGPDYLLQTKPVQTGLTLGISALLTFGAAGLTAAGYWAYQEVVSGRAAATGSVRAPWLISLLPSLGAGGVTLLGGILIVIALILSVWMLLKPALGTELIKRQ